MEKAVEHNERDLSCLISWQRDNRQLGGGLKTSFAGPSWRGRDEFQSGWWKKTLNEKGATREKNRKEERMKRDPADVKRFEGLVRNSRKTCSKTNAALKSRGKERGP